MILFRLLKHSYEPPSLGGTTLLLGEGARPPVPPAGYGPGSQIIENLLQIPL